jgi:primosomal protein N' (replication factor Y) (superfamily II helicase)
MNIITVIPLSRSKVSQTLSYFTATEVPVGAVVTVPLRSKSIHAIVTKVQPASDLKVEIKRASFEIKKLTKVNTTHFFPAPFVQSALLLADYYATTVGAIIDSLIADTLLESLGKLKEPKLPELSGKMADETYVIQGDDSDRVSSWRSLIRQEFARKKSLVMYVPTIEDGEFFKEALSKGVEDYIFFLNAGLPKKKMAELWQKIAKAEHPILIIATSTFSLLPRSDIEIVILERENARGWISQKAPYIDGRHALETIIRKQKQTLYVADSILRTETLHRLDSHEIAEASPFKWRSISSAKDVLVDMREYKASEKNFRIISPEIEQLIERNHEDNTHLFILAVRRGLSSTTVCDDCETIVTCKNCSAPVVLHTSKESGRNFFMCHKCGERRSAEEMCINCGSWRLTPLGIGIDRVAEELRSKFPKTDVYQIDADTTKTEADIARALDSFYSKPGTILLGTETALLHLREKIEHVAVASLDSLFTLPDFRIQEKIMYMLVRMRNLAVRTILVQTRKPEEKVFEYGLKGNLSDFYRTTLDERKQFNYPPYSVLIKITLEGDKQKIAEEMATVQTAVHPHEIDIFPAFTSTVRGKSVIHGLIKVSRDMWPDHSLIARLRELPPNVKVKVQAESLL